MSRAGSVRGKSRVARRLAVLFGVVFAIALTIVGIARASQQTTALWLRLMGQAEGQARIIRNTTREHFERELQASLRRIADIRRARPDAPLDATAFAPIWIDGIYVWDGVAATVLALRRSPPKGFKSLLETHLARRALDRPVEVQSDRPELIHARADGIPLVIACLRATDARGRRVIYAALIDHLALKRELLEPQLAVGDGLEIVPTGEESGPWSLAMYSALRVWTIQPTEAFVREQRRTVIGQTYASFGLTILALVTVLAAMWFLVRVARREVDLAELKSNFVADVSHELKTPLALIRLFGETLQSGRVPSEEKRQEYYSIITRESTRLTSLINNILDFARIEAGRKEYTLQPTDVGQVVKETYEAYRAELDHGGFEHHLILADRLPPVDADAGAISQVLVNLIGNALKYAGTERYLAIEVGRDTRRGCRGVLIAVRDHGIGISPEDRIHLFDGFFRASDRRVREHGGAGLGLALVKHIVDAHHGSLEVESRLVKGSTFSVFLPASQRTEA